MRQACVLAWSAGRADNLHLLSVGRRSSLLSLTRNIPQREVCMRRTRLAPPNPLPFVTPARAWLAAAAGLAAAVFAVQAQTPPPAAPKAEEKSAAAALERPPSPEEAAALALDQKLIASAKDGSQIMANLTYLSDVIGPRLTGSA